MSDPIGSARRELTEQVEAARLCLAGRRVLSALVVTYAGMDAAAALTVEDPATKVRQRFEWWVETYLLPRTALKVTAVDLYAARCSVLHTLTARSDLSEAGKARRLLYGWGQGRAEDLDRINVAGGFTDRYAAVQVEDLISGFERGIAGVFDEVAVNAALQLGWSSAAARSTTASSRKGWLSSPTGTRRGSSSGRADRLTSPPRRRRRSGRADQQDRPTLPGGTPLCAARYSDQPLWKREEMAPRQQEVELRRQASVERRDTTPWLAPCGGGPTLPNEGPNWNE